MTPASCALQCRMHFPPICGAYWRSYGEQITAKLPHWSEGSSSCAGNSQKGSLPKFAAPTLVGTIKEIITDIFHFSAYVLLWGKPFSSTNVMLRVTAACMCILHAVAQGGGCWSSSRKCRKCQTASKHFVWPLYFFCLSRICREPLWARHLPKQCALLHKVSTDLRAVANPAARTFWLLFCCSDRCSAQLMLQICILRAHHQTKRRVICMLKILKRRKCSSNLKY